MSGWNSDLFLVKISHNKQETSKSNAVNILCLILFKCVIQEFLWDCVGNIIRDNVSGFISMQSHYMAVLGAWQHGADTSLTAALPDELFLLLTWKELQCEMAAYFRVHNENICA